MPRLSQLASHIAQSEIRIMSVECEKVGGVNLAQGICDTEVPLPVRRGAEAAIEGGFNSYTRLDGIANLRRAIARKMRDYNKVEADPEHEVVVTAGSTGAFYCACMALLNPADEVIVFEPYYGYHVHTLMAMHAVPAYVTLTPPDWSFPAQRWSGPSLPRRALSWSTRRPIPQAKFLPRKSWRGSPDLPASAICSSSPTRSTNIFSTTDAGTSARRPCPAWPSAALPFRDFPRPSASPAGASETPSVTT